MTRKEFSRSLIDLIGLMAEMNYSQDIIEITLGLILPLPTTQKAKAVLQFTDIAKMKLPEKNYHSEISKVFQKMMNY